MMEKIEEFESYGIGRDLGTKLNEVIRAVNSLICIQEKESKNGKHNRKNTY